ncbi:MAG: alpha/beta hydrolase [Brevefilum sp.]|nr:alpha/beta hydrolase [Brevefilum sp.]MDT8382028.1 alpha/beta hydrolase [Brevefilum sp.]
MKIRFNQIDKELRFNGRLVRLLNPTFTEGRLRLFAKLKYPPIFKDKSIDFIENYITRADGSNLRLCIYKPKNQKGDVPGVLWLHGGGYAIGTPEQSMSKLMRLINASQCVIIAPDYRLSTEAPYPAALEDSYTALLWMKDNASALGIREDQLMIGGDSAGGGLTAALTLYARDKGEVAIAFQMPLYPMLDDRMISESAVDNNAPVWNSKSNTNAWKLYLGDLFGTAKVPSYAAPARAEDFRDLPPTATFVGDLEPFRDETIEYVENLRKADVPVEFKIFKGCYHGFEQICPNANVSKQAISFFLSSYKYAVDHYFAEQSY